MTEDLRYPVGKFSGQPPRDDAERQEHVGDGGESLLRQLLVGVDGGFELGDGHGSSFCWNNQLCGVIADRPNARQERIFGRCGS